MTILNVPGMSCKHCVQRISDALKAAGIKFAVDLENKTVSVEEGKENEAVSELEDLGYEVSGRN